MKPSKAEILDSISRMSVVEMAQLVRELRDRFGVELTHSTGSRQEHREVFIIDDDLTSFNVILASAGAQKIQVIKAVREMTTLGLKEAKDLVEGAPSPVKEGVNKDEADALKRKLEDAGAIVEIKPA